MKRINDENVLNNQIPFMTFMPLTRHMNVEQGKTFLVSGGTPRDWEQKFILPNICNMPYGTSFLVSDPTGSIYNASKDMLTANGYDVKYFNLADPNTGGFNPFDWSDNCMELDWFITVIMNYTEGLKGTEDDHLWKKQEADLLFLALEKLFCDHPVPGTRNIEEIPGIIMEFEDHSARKAYFDSNAGKFRDTLYEIIVNINKELSLLDKDLMRAIATSLLTRFSFIGRFGFNDVNPVVLKKGDIDLETIFEHPSVIFVGHDPLSIFLILCSMFRMFIYYFEDQPSQHLCVMTDFLIPENILPQVCVQDLATAPNMTLTMFVYKPFLMKKVYGNHLDDVMIMFDALITLYTPSEEAYEKNISYRDPNLVIEESRRIDRESAGTIMKTQSCDEVIVNFRGEHILDKAYLIEEHPNFDQLNMKRIED